MEHTASQELQRATSEVKGKCLFLGPMENISDRASRFNVLYDWLVTPVANALGLDPIHPGHLTQSRAAMPTADMPTDILNLLKSCTLVIADLTDNNGTVGFEVGVSFAYEKPLLLLVDDLHKLPFYFKTKYAFQIDDHTQVAVVQTTKDKIMSQLADIQHSISATSDSTLIEQEQRFELLLNPYFSNFQQLIESLGDSIPNLVVEHLFHQPGLSITSRNKEEAGLLLSAMESSTHLLRNLHVALLHQRDHGSAVPVNKPLLLSAQHLEELKYIVLKVLCDILRRDARLFESNSDYFKATLFRLSEDRDELTLDIPYYPPSLPVRTKRISRKVDESKDQEYNPGATAFKCADTEAMVVIPDVAAEMQKPSDKREWQPLWTGQASQYGSMISAPITFGQKGSSQRSVIAVLTLDTNRRGYFSSAREDQAFLANLLGPFRHILSLIYLLEWNGQLVSDVQE